MSEVKIHCLFDEMVSPKKIKNHPKNNNKHGDDQISRLAKILEYQGFRYPIKVSKQTGYITSGHCRKLAAIRLGLKQIPVVYQDYDNMDQEMADLYADNSIASWSDFDLGAVNDEIGSFSPDFDIELLGIKDFTLDISDKIPENLIADDKEKKSGDFEHECPSCGFEYNK